MKKLKLKLKLFFSGIEIDSPPINFKKGGDNHVAWLAKLAEKYSDDHPMKKILQDAKTNLSCLTWQGLTRNAAIIKGTSGSPAGNYRLSIPFHQGNKKWTLSKSGSSAKPNFF